MIDSWLKPILEATATGFYPAVGEHSMPLVGGTVLALLLIVYAKKRLSSTRKSGKPTLADLGLGYRNQRPRRISTPEPVVVAPKEPILDWLHSPTIVSPDQHSNSMDPLVMETGADTSLSQGVYSQAIDPFVVDCSYSQRVDAIVDEPFVVNEFLLKDASIGTSVAFIASVHANVSMEEPFVVNPITLAVDHAEDVNASSLHVDTEALTIEEPLVVSPVTLAVNHAEDVNASSLHVDTEALAIEEPLVIAADSTVENHKNPAILADDAVKPFVFEGASEHIEVVDVQEPPSMPSFVLPSLLEPRIHPNSTKIMSCIDPISGGLYLGLQDKLWLSPRKWYRIEYLTQHNVLCERDIYIEYIVQGYNNKPWYQVRDRLLHFSGLICAANICTAINLTDSRLEFALSKPAMFDGVVYPPETNYVVDSATSFRMPWVKKSISKKLEWSNVTNPTWQAFAAVALHTFECMPMLINASVQDHLSRVLISLLDERKQGVSIDWNSLPSNTHWWYHLHSILDSNVSMASALVATVRDLAFLLERAREDREETMFVSMLEPVWLIEQRYTDVWGAQALLALQTAG